MQLLADTGLVASSSRALARAALLRPRDYAEALNALGTLPEAPILVAGGTDLVAQINEGAKPRCLMSLDRLADLRAITVTPDDILIGGCVTHAAGSNDPLICAHLPGLADAWRRIANVRVRLWATIGGNLMARRTRYEMSILLSALGARLVFDTPAGRVEKTPADIWTGAVPARALLHHVAVPRQSGPFIYDRSLRPIMTLALNLAPECRRAVIATEWLQPLVVPIPAGTGSRHAFAALPDSFFDVATSAWYLRRAGQALLDRHLKAVHG